VINTASKAPDRPVVEVTQPTCFIKTGTIRITNPLGENLTYSLDGKDYSNTTGIFTGIIPGTYFITVSNTQGCLSPPITTLLKATLVYNITENKTICQGQNYQGWTTSGTYQRKLQSKSGCDSTVTTILKVNPLYNIKENTYICQGESYNGWTTSGTYKRTFQSRSGCDSIVSTDLTVFPSYNPIIIAHGDTLQAIRQYKTYQWYNESGLIAGATTDMYVIRKSGKYHMVIKDENGCTNTSEVYNVIYSDVRINAYENFKYSIIPNPNIGQFTFRIDSDPGKGLILKLLNPLGQVIEIRPVKSVGINHMEQFNVSYLSKGIYFLNISSEQNLKTEKIIVQ
jgi:Secretion system C-terminal sorting domain